MITTIGVPALFGSLWLIAWAMSVPVWFPIASTGAMALGILILRRRYDARDSDSESDLSKWLYSSSKQKSPAAQPDAPRRRGFWHRRTEPFHTSPWVIVLGPSGAGKTTAIRDSGVERLRLSHTENLPLARAAQGCEFWAIHRMVVVDTPGRFVRDQGAQSADNEWALFLDFVRRNCRRKGLLRFIIVVPAHDLFRASEGTPLALAKSLRERLASISRRFRNPPTIQLLVTKCDLIPGFVETFSRTEMHPTEKSGRTLSCSVSVDARTSLTRQLEAIRTRLEAESLYRMGMTGDTTVTARIFEFPAHFERLEKGVLELTKGLLESPAVEEGPMCERIFFSSGTNTGEPLDFLVTRIANGFGVGCVAPKREAGARDPNDALKEAFYALLSHRGKRVSHVVPRGPSRVERMLSMGACCLALTFAGLAGFTWTEGRRLLRAASQMAAEGEKGPRYSEPFLPVLGPIRKTVEELMHWSSRSFHWPSLDTYSRGALHRPMRAVYASLVHESIVQPLLNLDASELLTLSRSHSRALGKALSPRDYSRLHDTLKRYLLLTSGKEAGEPKLSSETRTWLEKSLADAWSRRFRKLGKKDQRELHGHLRTYLQILARAPTYEERGSEIVRVARSTLVSMPFTDLTLGRLEHELGNASRQTLERLTGSSPLSLKAHRHVPGLFTREAWESVVRDRLPSLARELFADHWVLYGSKDASDSYASMLMRLRARYLERYVEEWMRFLDSIHLDPPKDDHETLLLLDTLTEGGAPVLGRLFRSLAFQLELTEAVTGGSKDALPKRLWTRVRSKFFGGSEQNDSNPSKVGPERVHSYGEDPLKQAFAGLLRFGVESSSESREGVQPLPLDTYQELLSKLRTAVQEHLESQDKVEPLVTQLEESQTRVRAILNAQDPRWRPKLAKLLLPPLDGVATLVSRASAHEVQRLWCSDIRTSFEQSLRAHYPFEGTSADAPLSDFSAFYHPKTGKLWTFYTKFLESTIPRSEGAFKLDAQLGKHAALFYSDRLPAFLEHAQSISSAFFPPGADMPKIELDVRIRPAPGATAISLSIGERKIDYQNGPELWVRTAWPGAEGFAGATLDVQGARGTHETIEERGEWGLFRLLERAVVRRRSMVPTVLAFTWRFPAREMDITIDIKPVRSHPLIFETAALRRAHKTTWLLFRSGEAFPPTSIAVGDAPCEVLR